MKPNAYFTYILTNHTNSVLYVGMTNNILRRIREHKAGEVPGFTHRYKVNKLVWSEEFADVRQAIKREKQLKNWRRDWKLNLIREANPDFQDLSSPWFEA